MRDRLNILLVDDQPAKLLSYEVMLAGLNENLVKAGSARDALEHLLKIEVALVLIDVCMPELDGFELASMIRDHPRFMHIPIIFVSAVQLTDLDRLRGYECGAVDYVPVPVVPDVLRAKVKVFVDLYRKTRDLERLNRELESRVGERTAALEASSAQLQALNAELELRIEERTREREQALAQLLEAQKLETIGQLTGGVAHDFNNLLMAILGSLELLRKRLPAEPQLHRHLDNAVQGAQRGAALTQRLLAFARRQELKLEAIGVADLLNGIEGLLERSLDPSVEVRLRIADGLPALWADANQLELALLNIALNARDAMPEGGVLTISARAEAVGGPFAGALAAGEYVVLSVGDTGGGMDAATLARATEPFFTTKGAGKGTGLGLSMVHGLAAQSGGTLRIESAVGKGTRVDLWLPRASPDVVPRQPATTSSGAGEPAETALAPCSVLVVDDDFLVRMGTVAMLEDLGHTVLEADSGAQALSLLETEPVDIVLTDYAMPNLNGMELARRVRSLRPGIAIVLASGYAELPKQAPDALSLERLSKPFCIEELSAALASVRGQPGPQ